MTDPPERNQFVELKEFVEAIFAEKERALAMANKERELAASVLRSEQQRALDQAAAERDKAASNLRIELGRALKEGDDRLREHISNQIAQIKAALESAEKLEVARLAQAQAEVESLTKMMNARFASIENEMQVSFASASKAIDKADTATERRFEGVNEFRAQLSDQAARFVTREELAGVVDKLNNVSERNRSDLENLAKRLT